MASLTTIQGQGKKPVTGTTGAEKVTQTGGAEKTSGPKTTGVSTTPVPSNDGVVNSNAVALKEAQHEGAGATSAANTHESA